MGDKNVYMKQGLCAHRLPFDGFSAGNGNPVACMPDLLGTFSNNIAIIEALRLPSLCLSFPFILFSFPLPAPAIMQSLYVFFRICEHRIKPQGGCPCW